MRIGVNTFFLQHPTTGSGQYCARLLEALGEVDQDNEYHLISPRFEASPSAALGAHRGPAGHAPTAVRLSTHVGRNALLPLNRQMAKVWFEQATVPRVCTREGIELIHYPYFAAPLVCSAKVVVTLHDLIPLVLDAYRGSPAVRAYSLLVSLGAKRASGIIADSECTRQDIVRVLGIPERRIRVVHLAPDDSFRRFADPAPAEGARAKYGLGTDFVFYLGGLDVRKNVGRLIQAFARLKREIGGDVQLAIAGQAMSEGTLFPNLEEVARSERIADSVIFLGKVPEEDCPSLYNAARLFVFPSLYEGFGLPPIEAMACGTPVICSKTSSLPEVVGDAAITVDPTNVDELAQAMRRVLESAPLQEELRQKGMLRAGRFTWRRTAEETLEAFKEFGGRTRRR